MPRDLPIMTDNDRDFLNDLLNRVTPAYVLASIAGYCDARARMASTVTHAPGCPAASPRKWQRAADRIMRTVESAAVRNVSAG